MKLNPINLELTFSDADSLKDYLKHYSYRYGGERRWRDLFVLYGVAGCVKHPFVWYSPLTKEYHVDVRVNYRTEAYTRLPRYRYNKINDHACFVQWDSRYSTNSMMVRIFEDNWRWSDKAVQEMLFYGDIYEKLSININVFEAKKYREYAPMFKCKKEDVDHLFELKFYDISHLTSYLEAREKDERIRVAHYLDHKKGTLEAVRQYPLIIRQLNDDLGQVLYFIDVWAKSRKDLRTFGYHADVLEVKEQGLYDGEPSCKYYAEVYCSDGYKYFPMHEGYYRFRTYEPDDNENEIVMGCTERWFEETKDEIYKHYMEKNFGVTKKSDENLVTVQQSMDLGRCNKNKSYMLCARGNGKSLRQLKEVFEHYLTTGDPVVAVNRKISIHDMDPDVRRYFESDIDVVKQTIELNSNFLKEELKERMNMMFGVDLNMIPEIKDVKFNNPATIVFWADGTKTVVKRQKGDRFDKEKGLAMAIVKKLYGNKGKYNDLFKKWIKEDK